jgi:hypothetical protein
MPDGTVIIRCPRCGHPYPMTPTQMSVFRGRNMGCMACGRPFEVQEPPPPPPPKPAATPIEPVGVLAAEGAVSVADPAGSAVAEGASAQNSTTETATSGMPPPLSAASANEIYQPTAPAAPTWLSVIGVAAGICAPIFIVIAAIAGSSSASDSEMIRAADSRTPVLMFRLALIAAGVGVALGGIVLLKTRRQGYEVSTAAPPQSRAWGWAAAGIGFIQMVVILLVATLAWPTLASSLADSHKASCQTELENVGRLLLSRAMSDPAGKYPDSLGGVIRSGDLSAPDLACPGSDDLPVRADLPAGTQAQLIDSGKHVSYVYLGSGLTVKPDGAGTRATTQTVIAYERPGHHGDKHGLHVLFADATVIYVEGEQADSIVTELSSGLNPPPTAAALRR